MLIFIICLINSTTLFYKYLLIKIKRDFSFFLNCMTLVILTVLYDKLGLDLLQISIGL